MRIRRKINGKHPTGAVKPMESADPINLDPGEPDTPSPQSQSFATSLSRAQYVHIALVNGGIYILTVAPAPHAVVEGWFWILLAWPLWMVRLVRSRWRDGWMGVFLTVMPSLFWPGLYALGRGLLGEVR